jgi:hypothetical protein
MNSRAEKASQLSKELLQSMMAFLKQQQATAEYDGITVIMGLAETLDDLMEQLPQPNPQRQVMSQVLGFLLNCQKKRDKEYDTRTTQ